MAVKYKSVEVARVSIGVQAERSRKAPSDYWSPMEGETELPAQDKLAKMLRNSINALGGEPDYVQCAVLNNAGLQLSKPIRFHERISGLDLESLMIEVFEMHIDSDKTTQSGQALNASDEDTDDRTFEEETLDQIHDVAVWLLTERTEEERDRAIEAIISLARYKQPILNDAELEKYNIGD